MVELTDERVAQYAQSMAHARDAFQFDMFRPLALGDGVREDELQREFQRVFSLYLRNQGRERCLRSKVHRHYMSCAQEAVWDTQMY